MLVCGEPSGDALGAQLMAGLKQLAPNRISFTGVGGLAMAREGLNSLYPLDATSVMGLREVVPAIPKILRHVKQAVNFAVQTKPDAVVVIDSPDFTHRVARGIRARDASIKTVDYVAPQVWASRAYRARAMAGYFDLVLALFPFEVDFFRKYGLKAAFVGHPVIERRARMTGGAALRARLGIAPQTPLLALLPGSRTSEIRFILPTFKEAVARLAQQVPGLVTVLPTVPHVAAKVRVAAAGWPTPLHIVENEADKYAAFDAADVALAASGTVTAELALARTPMIVAYRVGGLTYFLSRHLMTVTHITLINIILGREAVPEYLQGAATPQVLADAVTRLFRDADARAAQVAAMEEFAHALGADDEPPSLRAARVLLDFVQA
ncbi:MAG: Lipid-A-disaccharide synthase [Alphaproteobacteria bacterium]|nr:Lipid-A-disaccharide synthase [Alphaproteobacteria bacterium]MDB5740619.1 Lipid-A-disaccharide synthase [Alphaproteobacteria bacterium]